MTKVTIESGICGFSTTVTARMEEDGKNVSIAIESGCEMVEAMAGELTAVNKMSVFTGFLANPVYRAADKHLKHTACPVPSGIIKALEAEAGFCLPKNATIVFER